MSDNIYYVNFSHDVSFRRHVKSLFLFSLSPFRGLHDEFPLKGMQVRRRTFWEKELLTVMNAI